MDKRKSLTFTSEKIESRNRLLLQSLIGNQINHEKNKNQTSNFFFGAKTILVIFRRPVSHSVKNWNETVKREKTDKREKKDEFRQNWQRYRIFLRQCQQYHQIE